MASLLAKTKKELSRKTQVVMEKIGKTEGTHDASFDEQQKALERQHRAIEKLNKDVQRYFELLQEFSVTQSDIATGFTKMYDVQSMPLHDVVHNNVEIVKLIDQSRAKTEEVMKENLILPTVKYLGQFKDIQDRLKEHETRRIDMDRYSRDVKSLQGNPKLQTAEQKLEAAKQNYNNLHNELTHDMKALQQDKDVYFIYALATYVVACNAYFTEAANLTNQVINPVLSINRSDIHTRDSVITPQNLSASFGVSKNMMGFSAESGSQKGRPSGMQQAQIPQTYTAPPPTQTPPGHYTAPPQQAPQTQTFDYPPPQKPLPVPVKKTAQ